MSPFTADDGADVERRRGKARTKGKIPFPPDRNEPLSAVRSWLSDAAGLPDEVRIESVLRTGREPEDALTIVLSNGQKMRCSHQGRLQQARTLQAFLVSESDGIALAPYLSPAEVGDFFTGLCRLGTATAHPDPVADLAERLDAFVSLCEPLQGSLIDRLRRYTTIEAIRQRHPFDRSTVAAMRNGKPESPPVVLLDHVDDARYVRASEWVVYLRFVIGWTVNESQLVGRMAELGSERSHPQAWNVGRSHRTHLVFYSLPENDN